MAMSKWKKTLWILLFLLFAFLISYKMGWLDDYWELINILPIPSNIKSFSRHIRRRLNVTTGGKTYSNGHPHPHPHPHPQTGSFQKRNVTPFQKKMVASNQQWKCNMCQKILDYTYEVDHKIPLFKGGNNHTDNLQALCRNCHGKKTAMDRQSK